MPKYKGIWISSHYCNECRSMFFTPDSKDPWRCPYCESESVSIKADRILINPTNWWELDEGLIFKALTKN